MQSRALYVLPATIGCLAMAWSIHLSNAFAETDATGLAWRLVLLGPFVFVGAVAWRARPGPSASALAVLPALLLMASPVTCLVDGFGEGCQYVLVLSPIYLWAIVGLAAILELWTRKSALSQGEAES